MLCDEDKRHIDFDHSDKLTVLEDIRKAVQEKKELCIQRCWTYKKSNGETVMLRDQIEKVMVWVDKFKSVGDNAMQYDPVHAALPWAGVRFLLQVGWMREVLICANHVSSCQLMIFKHSAAWLRGWNLSRVSSYATWSLSVSIWADHRH